MIDPNNTRDLSEKMRLAAEFEKTLLNSQPYHKTINTVSEISKTAGLFIDNIIK